MLACHLCIGADMCTLTCHMCIDMSCVLTLTCLCIYPDMSCVLTPTCLCNYTDVSCSLTQTSHLCCTTDMSEFIVRLLCMIFAIGGNTV